MKMRKLFTTVMAITMLFTLFSGMTAMGIEKGENVLQNPGFDQLENEQVTAWETKGNVFLNDTPEYAKSDKYSMALVGDKAYLEQPINVQGGVKHWTDCWIYVLPSAVEEDTGKISSWFQIQVQYYDEPLHNGTVQGNSLGNAVQIKNQTVSVEGFVHVTGSDWEYTPPEGAQSAIFTVRTRSATTNIRVDDVKTGPYTNLDEVVRNGGFEQNAADEGAPSVWPGWSHPNHPGSTALLTNKDAKSGDYALKISLGNTLSSLTSIQKNISCKPNTDYIFSFWYKATAAWLDSYVSFRMEDGTTADSTAKSLFQTQSAISNSGKAFTSAGWEQYTAYLRSGKDTTNVEICLRACTKGGTVLFDDVSLKEDKTALSFTDTTTAATPLETFAPGQDVKVNYHHVAKADNEPVAVCVALYKKDGNVDSLHAVELLSNTVNIGTPWDVTHTVDVPEVAGDYTIKVFTWDTFASLDASGIKRVIRSTTPSAS